MDIFTLLHGGPLTFDPVTIALTYFVWRQSQDIVAIKINAARRESKLDSLAAQLSSKNRENVIRLRSITQREKG